MSTKGLTSRRGLWSILLVGCMALLLLSAALVTYQVRRAHADTGAPTTTINWNDVHQTIDGFGVASTWSADVLQSFPEPQRSRVLDLLFSPKVGAGFSIVRNEIGAGSGVPANTNTQTIEPTQGNWNWNVDAGQIWEMQQAQQRGVSTFVSAAWSEPAWMKVNNSVTNGGHLRRDMYQAYADYLARYVIGYKNHFGLKISAISPANEPNTVGAYQTNEWTAAEFDTFIKSYLNPTFQKQHVPAQVYMPEEAIWADDLASATLSDPAASAGVSIVAAHDYAFSAPTPFVDAQAQGKHQWMSEVSGGSNNPADINDALKWAYEIHTHMTVAHSNAWNWWIGVEPGTPANGDGQPLIYLDGSSGVYSAAKRLFSIGNFSRFIRPGYVRLGATDNPAAGLYTSAYKNPQNNQVVIVALNKTTGTQPLNISLNGVNMNLLSQYVTAQNESLERNSDVMLANNSATVYLPSQSVVTFVGSTTLAKTESFVDPLNDFSLVSAKTDTSNSFIDSANLSNFDLDGSRASRAQNLDSSLIYNIQGMQAATITAYVSNTYPDSNNIVLKASGDGTTYTTLTPTLDTPVSINYWSRVHYSVKLPRHTNYLMIEIPPNTSNIDWTPEIANVNITVPLDATVPTPPVPTPTPGGFVDPLNDFSLTYAHSSNWFFDASHPATFNGDTSRAARTDNNDANFVYHIPGMQSTTVTLYYWGNAPDANNLVLKVSSDGTTFTPVTATQDTPTLTTDWYRVNYSVTGLPTGTAYLMVDVPPNTSNVSWTPQVSQVSIQ